MKMLQNYCARKVHGVRENWLGDKRKARSLNLQMYRRKNELYVDQDIYLQICYPLYTQNQITSRNYY